MSEEVALIEAVEHLTPVRLIDITWVGREDVVTMQAPLGFVRHITTMAQGRGSGTSQVPPRVCAPREPLDA